MLSRVFLLLSVQLATLAAWTTKENPGEPAGKFIDVARDGKLVARFVYGEGQMKPYLHLYGKNSDLLTEWNPKQQFPHHRGIFIGWNRIRSEIGSSDLWHLPRGEKMIVKDVRHAGGSDGATILAKIEWHAQKPDDSGDTILLNEMRRLTITQPAEHKTQVDARFSLLAMRDLTLDGDLQHAGIHFRGSHELTSRENETRYLWEPELPGDGGKVVSPDMKWCHLIFPIGANWYRVTQLNAPGNPTEELSWRAYGRFGFFFKKELEWGDKLEVNYRFIAQPASEPASKKLAAEREECEREYEKFAR